LCSTSSTTTSITSSTTTFTSTSAPLLPLPLAAPPPHPLGKEILSVPPPLCKEGIEAASVAAGLGLDAGVGVALADAIEKQKPRSLLEFPVPSLDLLDPANIAKNQNVYTNGSLIYLLK